MSLTTMTIAQLKQVCDQKKIVYLSNVTKPELIKLIENQGTETPAKEGKKFRGEH